MRIKTVASILFALAGSAVAVQLPLRVNFQGKLLDPATNNPRSGSIAMQFRVFDAPNGGTLLWGPESQTVAVNNGVFSVQLGSITALNGDIFSGTSAYLSVTVSPDNFGDSPPGGEILPRQRLVMSPYAFTAAQLVSDAPVRVNAGLTYSTFTTEGHLQLPGAVLAVSGGLTGSLTASSGTFTGAGTGRGVSVTYEISAGSAVFGVGAAVSRFTDAGDLQLVGGSTLTTNGTLTISTSATSDSTVNRAVMIHPTGAVVVASTMTLAPPLQFLVYPPAPQTIGAGATITANACGTWKRITAAGAVTTSTTDTFTQPTAAYAGCCMDVTNVGTNQITLDDNARCFTVGTGLALTADDSARFCSDGTRWIQVTPIVAP